MSNNNNPSDLSRRKFIRGIGAGVVGGAVLPGALRPAVKKEPEAPPHSDKTAINLKVNGKAVRALVESSATLVQLLREQLFLTSPKVMCNHGECGACTVLLNGKAVYSCHMLAVDAEGADVVTVEGLMTGEKLHPLQEAFIEHDGLQCGFCTPGQVMAAQALLLKYKKPSAQQVKDGMSGNLCRCGAYPNILAAVMAAADNGGEG